MAKNKETKRRINWAMIIAVVLAIAVTVETAGIFLGWFVPRGGDEAGGWNGLIATPDNEGSAMKMSVTRSGLNDEGAQEEGFYELTVTMNEDATYKDVTWSFGWVYDGSSEERGPSSEYFELIPNGLTATARAKQALPWAIEVSVTSDYDKSKSAKCRFDYLKELQSVEVTFGEPAELDGYRYFVVDGPTAYTLTPIYGVGTVQGSIENLTFRWSPNTAQFKYSSYFIKAQQLDERIQPIKVSGYVDLNDITENAVNLKYTDFFCYKDAEGNEKPITELELSEEVTTNLKAAVASMVNKNSQSIISFDYHYGEYVKKISSNYFQTTFDTGNLGAPVTDIELDKDHVIIYPN